MLLTLAAFAGALLCAYIAHKKRSGQPLVCPLKTRCDDVLHSRFSRWWGLPIEHLGLGYYGALVLIHLLRWGTGLLENPLWSVGIFLLSALAFCFSLYLIAAQAFVLRKGCTWCLMSAGLCAVIFGLSLTNQW